MSQKLQQVHTYENEASCLLFTITPTRMTIVFGAIHTSELDRSENGLSPNRSECERSNAN